MPGAQTAEATEFRRELYFSIAPASNIERSGDGLIVHDVNLLAAGTWTDSATRSPCEYAPGILEQFSGNWADTSLWSRHMGGAPRRITEKVGSVTNPRFSGDAVVGDLHLHGLTTESKDTIAMVEAGEANYVSVEHTGRERWNVGKKLHEAQEILFLGAAVVHRGACSKCTLRANEGDPTDPDPVPEAPPDDEPETSEGDDGQDIPPDSSEETEPDMTENDPNTPELDAKIAALEAAIVEKTAALEAATTEIADVKRLLGEAQEKIAAYADVDARLKKLEAAPDRKTRIEADSARELAVPTDGIVIDRSSGEVYGA